MLGLGVDEHDRAVAQLEDICDAAFPEEGLAGMAELIVTSSSPVNCETAGRIEGALME